jgi:hypothetical protein
MEFSQDFMNQPQMNADENEYCGQSVNLAAMPFPGKADLGPDGHSECMAGMTASRRMVEG